MLYQLHGMLEYSVEWQNISDKELVVRLTEVLVQ
jgi:hypothetical protein